MSIDESRRPSSKLGWAIPVNQLLIDRPDTRVALHYILVSRACLEFALAVWLGNLDDERRWTTALMEPAQAGLAVLRPRFAVRSEDAVATDVSRNEARAVKGPVLFGGATSARAWGDGQADLDYRLWLAPLPTTAIHLEVDWPRRDGVGGQITVDDQDWARLAERELTRGGGSQS